MREIVDVHPNEMKKYIWNHGLPDVDSRVCFLWILFLYCTSKLYRIFHGGAIHHCSCIQVYAFWYSTKCMLHRHPLFRFYLVLQLQPFFAIPRASSLVFPLVLGLGRDSWEGEGGYQPLSLPLGVLEKYVCRSMFRKAGGPEAGPFCCNPIKTLLTLTSLNFLASFNIFGWSQFNTFYARHGVMQKTLGARTTG